MIGITGRDRVERALVVVAHPDDETFGTGSLLLHLAAGGVTTAVCCASRGEAGEVRDGVELPAGGLGALRESELRRAAEMLGVREVFLLDLVDSGMAGPARACSIVGVPGQELITRIDRVVSEFGPDTIITLDGSDGHRDHLRVRDAVTLVAGEHGVPVWLQCVPRSLMRRWAEYAASETPDSPYLTLGDLGTPDEAVTTRLDTSAYYDRRLEAIAAHHSQVSPFESLPEDLRRGFLTVEHLVLCAGDPDLARHHHGSPGCYWDCTDAAWHCASATGVTGGAGLDTALA